MCIRDSITSQGWLFSAVIIFLGNALVLVIGAQLLTGHGLFQALSVWVQCNDRVLHRLAHLL